MTLAKQLLLPSVVALSVVVLGSFYADCTVFIVMLSAVMLGIV
jgi:hypothetical protein